MSGEKRRIEKVESSLNPKQAILAWMQEAHGFNTAEGYLNHLITVPDSLWPMARLTDQVTEGVKQAMKGKPREDIDRAARRARREVVFHYFLRQRLNTYLMEENRYHWTQVSLMVSRLGALFREQVLQDQRRTGAIQAVLAMPYPLDPQTAAAVGAAQHNCVLAWAILERDEELNKWVVDSFLNEGKTALPDYAYMMTGNYRSGQTKTPTLEEVHRLFGSSEGFRKFLAGEDYS